MSGDPTSGQARHALPMGLGVEEVQRLSPVTRRVLLVLAEAADDTGVAVISLPEIEQRARASAEGLRLALRRLEEMRFVARLTRGQRGRGRIGRYELRPRSDRERNPRKTPTCLAHDLDVAAILEAIGVIDLADAEIRDAWDSLATVALVRRWRRYLSRAQLVRAAAEAAAAMIEREAYPRFPADLDPWIEVACRYPTAYGEE